MKPKDLLDDLEAGDRTMEHLKEEPEPQHQAWIGSGLGNTLSGLGQIIGGGLYGGQMAQQQANQFATYTTSNAGSIQGGTLRW